MRPMILVLGLAASLGGCANLTPQQVSNLQLELAIAKQVGHDAVSLWCAASGIVYVIADQATGSRANPSGTVAALRNNANAAAAACPMIQEVTGVAVASSVPPGAVASPITAK